MSTIIYFLLCIGYIFLFISGLLLSKKYGLFHLTNVLLLVIIALIYDNLIVASGKFIGEGALLEKLTYPRYWLHGIFTPTLILFSWSICHEIGLKWAHKTGWKVLIWSLTVGLIVYEIMTSVKGLTFEPSWENGILTYDKVGFGSPIMVIAVTIVILIVSIILLKKFHYYWLFVGTLIMLLGGFVTIWVKTIPIMNMMEFVLIFSLLMTKRFLNEHG